MFRLDDVWRSGKRAVLAFGVPLIIVGGMVLGIFTPSEAGAFAVVYAFFISAFIFKSLTVSGLYRVLVNSVQLSGELLIIVGLSFALGAGLTNAHVPEFLVRIIDTVVIVDSEYLRIFALILLAIVAGMILDPSFQYCCPLFYRLS